MEPPFGDSPTIPMLPPRDDGTSQQTHQSQQPQPYQYPPQYPQHYPPTPAWPAPTQQQTPYPNQYQMAPYAPYVRQPVAGPGSDAGAGAGRLRTQRMPRVQALELLGRLKRWSIALAVAAFVAFVGLAAGHVTGVTAAQAGSSSSSNTNASPPEHHDDDGGFFGGQQNNGNGGGFFGSGGSGAPSSGTSTS